MASNALKALPAQTTIELVAILPLLVVLMAFAVDIAGLWNARSRLEAASSEGARLAAADPSASDSEIAEAVRAASGFEDDVEIEIKRAPIPQKDVDMSTRTGSISARYERSNVEVACSANVYTIMPLGLLGAPAAADGRITLEAATTVVASRLEAS